MSKERKAALVLSDGSIFRGIGFGATERRVGEIVFTTSMTGYEESLTDPSYAGQILVSTYPLIGNYGTRKDWCESEQMQVEGYAIRRLCMEPRHEGSSAPLSKRMEDAGIPGIEGIDTRMLVKKIREAGVMPACLSVSDKEEDPQELLSLSRELDYSKINFVEKVSIGRATTFGKGGKKVVLIDYGVKMGIVHELVKRGCEVTVVPSSTSAEEVMTFKPSGIIASNGPGDPALMQKEAAELKKLFGRVPIFGICLGNQLLAQAVSGKTYKLKFGHRGGNHPVLDMQQNKVHITTQNHGYAVDEKTIPQEFEITHRNLIDNTVEGMQHRELPIFAVQYHPEANPGPCDSKYLFDKFVKMI